jgi:hypothetical protein
MVDMRSESGFTPLHFAVSASNSSAVKALLENGASLNSEVLVSACYSIWPTQSTPLHIAAAKGSFSVVKYLLQAQLGLPHPAADMRTRRDSNGRRPLDIARQVQHLRLVSMLDPEVPLRHALSQHSQRLALSTGPLPLTVLAGRVVQAALLAELDLLAWQLRLRDGAEAAMPRSLKRQLMKSSRKAILKSQAPAGQSSGAAEGAESYVSSDSEGKDKPGCGEACASGPKGEQEGALPAEGAVPEIRPSMDSTAEVAASGPSGDDLEVQPASDCAKGTPNCECGVCLDRPTQLLFKECHHECCHACAMTIVKKAKLTKGSIRCPFCRGIACGFLLKTKSEPEQPSRTQLRSEIVGVA